MGNLSLFKEQFNNRDGIHFNNAGQSPISNQAADRVKQVLEIQHQRATRGDSELLSMLGVARERLAHFLGASASEVAYTQNCASALSQAALGFPLAKGDVVITLDQEYASNFYPWKTACERSGARLEVVPSHSNLEVNLEALYSAMRPPVKVVAVSWVQFQTGSVLDLKKLGDHCHAQGAFLVVDGIQALGQLPFSFHDLPVDFIAGASHKWISGPLGQGFFAVKPELMKLLSPVLIGAGTYNRRGNFADPHAAMMDSAMRFEPGGLAFLPLFGMDSAIELLLETGMDQIESEIRKLSSRLRAGILALGLKLVTPLEQRGGITSLQMEPELETRFLNRCRELNISIMKRGEVVRISPHAFCNEAEVEQVLHVLKGVTL